MKTSKLGVQFPDSVPDALISALEAAREDRKPVRLFYGDQKTGEDWLEETHVSGLLGYVRFNKQKLLTIRPLNGGHASEVMVEHVVKLLVEGEMKWQHAKYHISPLTVHVEVQNGRPKWSVQGKNWSYFGFRSHLAAYRWISFMKGERGSK